MNTNEFIKSVCNEIKYKPATVPITEELKAHIEDIKEDKISAGISKEDVEEIAVKEMGNPKEIGKKLNKIHKPKLEWRILILTFSLILIKIFLYFKECINHYSSGYTMSKEIVFIIISLLLGLIIYFFDYKKIQKFSNHIFILATGLLIFQWIDKKFDICNTIWKTIHPLMYSEKYLPPILNMKLWYVSIFLYIVSFAGALVDGKKVKLITMYSLSALLIFFQSESIINSAILITSYLLMYTFKNINNKYMKTTNVIFFSFLSLFISICAISLLGYFNISFLAEKVYNNDFPEYHVEKENLLNNLKLFGETKNTFFKNTNSLFLQILSKIGIIPSSILVCIILLISIILILDSLKLKDFYGSILMIGLNTLYIAQSIIHILMNLNILPTSDINLPFISEGNLFFLVNVIAFAIIMSIYRRKNIIFT